jgi:hypothetical protein
MSKPTFTPVMSERITELFGLFKLPTLASETVKRFEKAGEHAALGVLLEVLELEVGDRRERRGRSTSSRLSPPTRKTLAKLLDASRLPPALVGQLPSSPPAPFLDRTTNVLAFGLPGTGKTHAARALGHACRRGHAVLFTPAYELVQELLAAKRDLKLSRALRKLDAFELLILDDIGYVQQSAEETEVLFTLMAERYERRSLLVTSNLVFGEWDRIFQNPMTTAAAIDRWSTTRHSELTPTRTENAKKAKAASAQPKKSAA